MDQVQKLCIYQSQVTNVRALESGIKQVRKTINAALRRGDSPSAACHTRLYAITFCAWAEANFSKVLHTPYGFDSDEILQVSQQKKNGIASAWKKAVYLGLNHLSVKRGSFKPNARQTLERAIEKHVFEPAQLRNKLAHGQWLIALNRSNDAVEPKMTGFLDSIDIIRIDGWQACHRELAHLVETLIESPRRKFIGDLYAVAAKLEQEAKIATTRTLEAHVTILKRKGRGR